MTGQPAADLILITHEHGDHFDADTLTAIVGAGHQAGDQPGRVRNAAAPSCKAKATAIGNGEATTVGEIGIEAIPAYNLTRGAAAVPSGGPRQRLCADG